MASMIGLVGLHAFCTTELKSVQLNECSLFLTFKWVFVLQAREMHVCYTLSIVHDVSCF